MYIQLFLKKWIVLSTLYRNGYYGGGVEGWHDGITQPAVRDEQQQQQQQYQQSMYSCKMQGQPPR